MKKTHNLFFASNLFDSFKISYRGKTKKSTQYFIKEKSKMYFQIFNQIDWYLFVFRKLSKLAIQKLLTKKKTIFSIRCQFHQRFYIRIFRMNILLAAFSNLAKNSYEKRAHKTVMKSTAESNG